MAILSCRSKWIDRQNNDDNNEGVGTLESGQRRNGQWQGQDGGTGTSAQSTNNADKMFDLRQPKVKRLQGTKLILGLKSSDSPTVEEIKQAYKHALCTYRGNF